MRGNGESCFIPHPTLFRSLFPEHEIRVAQRDPKAYIDTLIRLFPNEAAGITGLFDDMGALATEVGRLSSARGQVDMSRFPLDFPALYKFHRMSWGEMVATRIVDPKLKAIVSGQWGYYGLPPSKLSCFYYALPFMGYLTYGGFYPKGRSQDISNALAQFIKERGGTILLNTKVVRILLEIARRKLHMIGALATWTARYYCRTRISSRIRAAIQGALVTICLLLGIIS